MKNTDRDRAIETLLRSRRADESGAACLDAESLAAWIDGGLSAEARERVEQHAADCARCQAVLASMARTVPETETRAWWRSAMAKWVVPVAAVATALVVWVAVQRDSDRPSTLQTPAAETAKAASAPAAPIVGASPQASPSPSRDSPALSARKGANDTTRKDQQRVVGGIAGGQIDAVQPLGRAGASGVAGGQAAVAAPLEPAPSPPPSPAAPLPSLPAAPPPQSSTPSSPQAKTAPQGAADTLTVTDATASRFVSADERGGGFGLGIREITSPDPNYRWRIVPPASIQRSTDGGRTWAVVDPVPGTASAGTAATILTSGASPARDVCWVVGRSGVVLLSTDGATWRRRQIPESLDLTSVRATDATHAVVIAANGREFSTADGGSTWTAAR